MKWFRLHSYHRLFYGLVLMTALSSCAPKLRNTSNLERLRAALAGDTTPPDIIQFEYPNKIVAGNQTLSIPILATDNSGSLAQYELEYSEDGTTFTRVAEALPEATTIQWQIPKVDISGVMLKLTVTDSAGNKNSQTSPAFQIDSTPPLAPQVKAESQLVSTSSGKYSFTIADCTDLSYIFIGTTSEKPTSNSTQGWQSCVTELGKITFTLPKEGLFQLSFWSKDSAGNVSDEASVISGIQFDATPPDLAFTAAPTLLSFLKGASSYTISWSAQDLVSGISGSLTLEYAQDGVTFSNLATLSAATTSYNWTVPLHDVNTAKLRLRATDQLGNSGSITTSPFVIDSTAPTVSLTSPSGTYRGGSTFNLNFTSSDTGSGVSSIVVQYASDGVTFTPIVTLPYYSTNYNWTVPLQDLSTAKLRVIASDGSGNSSSSTSSTFTIDSTSPTLTFTAPAASSYVNASNLAAITVSGTCSENGRTVNLTSTGGLSATPTCSSGSWSTSLNYTSISDGAITLTATQSDAVGNSSSASRVITKDTVAPALTKTSPANGTAAQSQLTIQGACESGVNINFSGTGILSNTSVPCTGGSYSQQIFFSNGDGTKSISISQTDLAGNTSTLTNSFVRDSVAPVLTQTVTSPIVNNSNSVTWSGACETGLSIVASGADSSSFACSSGTWSYTTQNQTTDATRTYTFVQTDLAGNSTSVSAQWTRDTTPPNLTFTSTSSWLTAGNTVTFTGTCESGRTITVAGGTDSGTTTCPGGTWTYTTQSQSTDATRTYTFAQTDLAGNSSNISGSWQRDTQGPALTISTASPVRNNSNTATFTGNCEIGLNVSISGTDTSSFACPSGTWSYTTSSQSTDGSRTFTVSQTNALSVTTSASISWIRDTTPPSFTSSQMSINSGASTTNSRYVQVTLQASDALSNITHFCLKYNDISAPSGTDSCWIAVNAPSPGLTVSQNLNLSGYTFSLGLASQAYTVYAWTKDQLGNISNLTGSGSGTSGTDLASITLDTGTPVAVTGVVAANTDTPSNPPTTSETTFTAGQTVYIKWRASASLALPSNPVQIYFSTDDSTWTSVASSLPNSAGTGCTISGSQTGCYSWNAPTNNFFRIKVAVTDSLNYTSQNSSGPLNSGTVRVIAGNTEPGLGGSAKSAMFFNDLSGNARFPDTNTLVVTDDGRIYFRDYRVGILTVDPSTGRLTTLIKTTGTSTGDGGPVTNATLKLPAKIAYDFQNRLLVYDYDRIRRIDLNVNPPTISTIIGGGTDTSDTIADPLTIQTQAIGATNDRNFRLRVPMIVAPNGDIYFTSDNIWPTFPFSATARRIRVYRANYSPSPRIESIYPGSTSVGAQGFPNLQLNTCGLSNLGMVFDPSTGALTYAHYLVTTTLNAGQTQCATGSDSVGDATVNLNVNTFESYGPHATSPGGRVLAMVTGHNGKLYAFNREAGFIYSFNPDLSHATSGSYTVIAGTGTAGTCTDGTVATSCKINPIDVYVDSTGQVFFMDRGLLRTITASGTIVTVAGQGFDYGDGGLAVDARFGLADSIDIHRSGGNKVVIYDGVTARIREFTVDGTITTIAGNGTSASADTTTQANAQGITAIGNHEWDFIVADRTTGDVYATFNTNYPAVGKLTRTTGLWSRLFGGGSTNYSSNDGNLGTQAGYITGWAGQYPVVLGINSSEIMLQTFQGTATTTIGAIANVMAKTISISTGIQSHLAGPVADPYNATLCADGTSTSSCTLFNDESSLMRAHYDTTNSRWIMGIQGYTYLYTLTPGGTKQNWVTGLNAIKSFAYKESTQTIYYCATDGRIYKKVYGGAHTALAWPITSMSCFGNGMVYDEVRDVIIFPFTQAGLYGIAEHSGL